LPAAGKRYPRHLSPALCVASKPGKTEYASVLVTRSVVLPVFPCGDLGTYTSYISTHESLAWFGGEGRARLTPP